MGKSVPKNTSRVRFMDVSLDPDIWYRLRGKSKINRRISIKYGQMVSEEELCERRGPKVWSVWGVEGKWIRSERKF